MKLPSSVVVRDVAPRFGFQGEKDPISTENKIKIIEGIAQAGIRRIECTSFVSRRAVPQLADAEGVIAQIKRIPGTSYECCIMNIRGAERAIKANVDAMWLMLMIDDDFNLLHMGKTIKEAMDELFTIVEIGHRAGVRVASYMGAATGDLYSGEVPEERVFWASDELAQIGVDEFNIADSWGFGNPAQMEHLAGTLLDRHPEIPLVLHIHDTRRMGLANVLACLQVGVTTIDTALGGMGAHPILPGAQGGICTEDLVHMLNLMGVNTGVDLDGLIKVSMMAQEIVGHELRGRIIKVGKTFTTYPRPDSFSWPDRH